MNPREKVKALLPLIQAWSEGKAIEIWIGGRWMDISSNDLLEWFGNNYKETAETLRIKPERREYWLAPCALVKDGTLHAWRDEESARECADRNGYTLVHVREVL